MDDLAEDIRALINSHSREADSDTPDFILAEYLLASLCAFEVGVNRRDGFYGLHLKLERVHQLHWEFDNHTEFKSQTDAKTGEEIRAWTEATKEEFHLPEGAQWLMVNEDSEYFMRAALPQKVT
ncbi:hypothetical protein LCGC14_1546020 [marine sediment metagenome]|uniref:Uncharacterized protein n=1 Tax=marine sediment metagenome TaxID=412755 RepID=A0A0F9JCJ2_9ZZZZ